MVKFAVFFTLGVWLLQQQAALPDLAWAWLMLPLLLSFLLPQRSQWQRIARLSLFAMLVFLSGFFYAAGFAQFAKTRRDRTGLVAQVVEIDAMHGRIARNLVQFGSDTPGHLDQVRIAFP